MKRQRIEDRWTYKAKINIEDGLKPLCSYLASKDEVVPYTAVKKRRESNNFFFILNSLQTWPHMRTMSSYEASWRIDTSFTVITLSVADSSCRYKSDSCRCIARRTRKLLVFGTWICARSSPHPCRFKSPFHARVDTWACEDQRDVIVVLVHLGFSPPF